MSYLEKKNQIDELQKRIDSYGELSPEIKKKINYKFRLDWNYFSNSMEGNTLTIDETRSVMVGNITVGGKPIKDILEIKGHDQVITKIIALGKAENRLSEERILEIHKAIMYEDDENIKSKIGIWKKEINYIINYRNERFDFLDPSDVKEAMHTLLNQTNAAIDSINFKKDNILHPVDIALKFHLDYISIHPFYDGNGRTARILTNLILISFGYPPIWIKTNEREIYYQYLGDIQCYGGDTELFYEFMADKILRSQKIILDAISGKEIQEPDDLDKKISMLERELESVDSNEEVKIRLNVDYFSEILNTWLSDLLIKAIPKIQKFNHFFNGTQHHISITNMSSYSQFVNEPYEKIINALKTEFERNIDRFQPHDLRVTFNTFYGNFVKGGLKTFGCNYGFEIKFDNIKYEVFVDEFAEANERNQTKLFERLLHKPLTENDITEIVNRLTNAIFEHIDINSKKNGLR
ncbi:MAG: hypothetical protein CFE25_10515 [Chitinophagaceae bacterium BSSC1]|nr:MAG: hypothetical protein CFE25_10515 [Chitinophagaceae bacterium BSSC1]